MLALPNVYIAGSQCTRKTTLVNAFIEHLSHGPPVERPSVIEEGSGSSCRLVGSRQTRFRSSKEQTMKLQRLIMEAQFESEKLRLERSSWNISDRSALNNIVYAWKNAGREAAKELPKAAKWAEMRYRMARSLVIVCEAGADWLQGDDLRLMPTNWEEWLEVRTGFCQALEDFGLAYEVLSCEAVAMEDRAEVVATTFTRTSCITENE
ncbi:hypothetical protein DL767_001794 [Monosporascus sp. MG133]|nr:hypothetical protein DL767_001794 [Monosporascus sp. MG133]